MALTLDEAWDRAENFITYNPNKEAGNEAFDNNVFHILEKHDFMDFLVELLLSNFDCELDNRILPTFKNKLLNSGHEHLPDCIDFLNQNIRWYFTTLKKLTSNCEYKSKLKINFKAAIFELIHNKDVVKCFNLFYTLSFQKFTDEEHGSNGGADSINYDLDLGLFGSLFIEPVTIVLQSQIKRHVEELCKGKYEECWLNGDLENWLEQQVLPWVRCILSAQQSKTLWFDSDEMLEQNHIDEITISHWKSKVTNILYETYTQMRIGEMFNIITDYPESTPAIEDLKLCLEHTNQRPYFIDALKRDLPKRVLHPGVCTSDIITLYIPAVKILRMLDSTGVVMEIVLEPFTKYLKLRDDAVKMIMIGLLDEENGINELASELAQGTQDHENTTVIGDSSDGFLSEKLPNDPEDWKPDPREADPEKSNKFQRTSDIISLLFGMYGTKDRFILEYQKLLSQRLLSTWFTESSEDSEIKNLELLKLRFGEDNMVKCAVMLKDIADSRRINTYVKDEFMKTVEQKPSIDVSTMIMSSECWPDVQPHELVLPNAVQNALEIFKNGFDSHKASRSLKWMHNIGKVDLEIELADRTLTFNHITPLLASIIHLFQENNKWSLPEISNKLKVPSAMIKRKISYWLQEGVLKEHEDGVYIISECSSASYSGGNRSMVHHEDEDEDLENNESEKQKEELVLWNYIKGMLQNFESLPVDKIHKMLKMFAMQDASIMMEQSKLNALLQRKVQEGILTFTHGQYKIVN